MILCITPNPAIDRTLVLPRLTPGEVLRPEQVIVEAGGKGLNVARALRVLGSAARCWGPAGGHNGRLLAELAAAEGLGAAWAEVSGETRICTILVDRASGLSTGIYERGAALAPGEWARLAGDALRLAGECSLACISGSLPAGAPPQALGELVAALQAAGRPVWVDTSGPALEAALRARPAGVKVNHEEAGALLGAAIDSVPAAAAAARALHAAGAGQAVVTLGRLGAVLAGPAGCWHAAAPAVRAISAVGSGDACFAGLLHGLASGAAPALALGAGVAAGAANARHAGAGRFTREEYDEALRAAMAATRGLT
jgi:1-phosphofructokinase family hexose kinase